MHTFFVLSKSHKNIVHELLLTTNVFSTLLFEFFLQVVFIHSCLGIYDIVEPLEMSHHQIWEDKDTPLPVIVNWASDILNE